MGGRGALRPTVHAVDHAGHATGGRGPRRPSSRQNHRFFGRQNPGSGTMSIVPRHSLVVLGTTGATGAAVVDAEVAVALAALAGAGNRSEERRVGNGWLRQGKSLCSPVP